MPNEGMPEKFSIPTRQYGEWRDEDFNPAYHTLYIRANLYNEACAKLARYEAAIELAKDDVLNDMEGKLVHALANPGPTRDQRIARYEVALKEIASLDRTSIDEAPGIARAALSPDPDTGERT